MHNLPMGNSELAADHTDNHIDGELMMVDILWLIFVAAALHFV